MPFVEETIARIVNERLASGRQLLVYSPEVNSDGQLEFGLPGPARRSC